MKKPKTTAIVRVDNPGYVALRPESDSNPRVIEAIVSLRDSSVVTMATHGVLDADQVAAAWRLRKAWEVLVGLRRPTHLFERIDGCGIARRSEREEEARGELRRCRELLGAHGFDLLVKVCAEGYHIRDLYPTRRERDTATDLLRIHLTSLAGLMRG